MLFLSTPGFTLADHAMEEILLISSLLIALMIALWRCSSPSMGSAPCGSAGAHRDWRPRWRDPFW